MSINNIYFEKKEQERHCNWTYTGEFEVNKQGAIKKAEYETDCGKTVYWTRTNNIGRLFKKYEEPYIQGQFNVMCPHCNRILNIFNPYDDGETVYIKEKE